jgi:hypothetical protein
MQKIVFKDSVSLTREGSGIEFCGDRQYSISSSSVLKSTLGEAELIIDPKSGLVSVYTENSALVGDHTVTVTAKLVNHPTVDSATVTFVVKILPCILKSFTMTNLITQTYTIASPTLSWSIVGSDLTTQVPACGYTQTLTVSAIPSFVNPMSATGSVINLSISTRDVSNAGTY